MKSGVEEAKRKQLEAESKFKHMEGRVENLKARIKELEDNNKVRCLMQKPQGGYSRVFQNLDFGSDPSVPLEFGAPI